MVTKCPTCGKEGDPFPVIPEGMHGKFCTFERNTNRRIVPCKYGELKRCDRCSNYPNKKGG